MNKLTEKEQKIIKDIFPLLKDRHYNEAFSKIADNIPISIALETSSFESYNTTFRIINFLKANGIDLMHEVN